MVYFKLQRCTSHKNGKISQDEQSGICKKWEAMYQRLWVVARQVDDVVGDDEDDKVFEMDKAVLYAEV